MRLTSQRPLAAFAVMVLVATAVVVVPSVAGVEDLPGPAAVEPAQAYESYHDGSGAGYCQSCHGDFRGGGISLHPDHTALTGNCTLCHEPAGKANPFTNWSEGDGTANSELGCAGCHGRDYGETTSASGSTTPKSSAYGLAAHHDVSGATSVCVACHSTGTILPENVAPLYFGRGDVSISDPCADNLDNDGDGLYDALDPDCIDNVAPTADANGPYTGIVGTPVTFDGSGSTDSDGSIASYDWDFGDGGTGTGMMPSYTYAADGTYTVTLTVTDDGGLTDTATSTATIDPIPNVAPTADANGPYSGTAGVAVVFDGSGSVDTDGTIVSYDWDFGDGGTGTGVAPSYIYVAEGTYTVSLTVTDDDGASDTATSTATIAPAPNVPPTADANGPYGATVGTSILFDGSASVDTDGTIVSYDWDFGDGGTGTGVTPSYAYATDGTFTVTLTVTDDDGATDSDTSTAVITLVPNVPPTADANGPYTGTAGVAVDFDGSGSVDTDGSIVSYAWDFGDGGTGTGVSPSHIYAAAGTFTVSLTVIDDGGLSDTATSTATIDPAPNVAPIADANGPYTGTAGIAVSFDGSGSFDTDGSIVSYAWDFGDGGTGTGVSPSYIYAAAGTYTVSLTVTDDGGLTDTATSAASIGAVNVAPTADANGPYSGTAGVAVVFDGSGSVDTDGTIVSYDWDFGDGGTGTGVAPSYIYVAEGTYTVSLTVTDSGGLTDTDASSAVIDPAANVPPTAVNDSYSTTAGITLTVAAPGVLGNDSDGDGDPLTAVLATNVSNGSLTLNANGSFAYVPNAGFVGSDSFTYVANDGLVDSLAATVTIGVNPAGTVRAVNDSYTTSAGTPLSVAAPGVLANDAGSSSLWAFKRSNPANGSLSFSYTGSFTYTPNAGFTGTDSFTYDFWDSVALKYSNVATVSIEVGGVGNVAPTADANGPYGGTVGAAVMFDGSGSFDSDGSLVSYMWDFGDGATGNGVSPTHVYAAAGTYTVTLTVTDDGGLTDSDSSSAMISDVPNVAPTADADGPYSAQVGAAVTFDGSGSFDTDGTIVSYMWDFGDGSTGAGVAPSHAYAAAGTYTVTLTVTDDGGLTDSDTSTATISDVPNVAPTADADGPYSAQVGAAVTFDGSGSFDTDGTIVSYMWDFGDGSTGAGVAPSHAYAAAGTYTVTLTVTDDGGLTDSDTSMATISDVPNVAPTADANGPYLGTAGLPVTFDGSGSFDSDGTIVSYMWDFGDGATGNGVSPTHVYAAAGSYTVTLTVTDDGGLTDSDTSSAVIDPAPNVAPTADAGGPYSGVAGEAVSFDGSGSFDTDGTIVSYDWDFGDGSTGSGVMASHTYVAAGTYTATLTVTDDGGLSDTDTASVTIEPADADADLDINAFVATRRVKLDKFKPVELTLWVRNNGTAQILDGSFGATATIVGVLDGDEIFTTTFPIWDSLADGSTEFEVLITDRSIFRVGQVKWTATLDVPGDGDVDKAVAYTSVTERRR